jgi:mannose/fructose/N-acetylgalactosamine-specific phosphotransferase system component IIB
MSYIIRIDDRLVHGQVVEGWIKPLSIEDIVVCSNEVYCDEVSKTLFEMSVPSYITLKCLSVQNTAEEIVEGKYEKKNTLILIASLKDLYELVVKIKQKLHEYKLPNVNVGGIRYIPERKQIYKALFLNKQDIEIIKQLDKLGVVLEYYVLPNDEKILLNNKIQQLENIVEGKIK